MDEANQVGILAASVANALRPVLLIKDGSKRISACGTAVVVGIGPNRIVVTAEHVLAGNERKKVLSPCAGLADWPAGRKRLVSLADSCLDPDLTWSELSNSDATQWHDFINIGTFLDRIHVPDGIEFLAAGFPASKTKIWQGQHQINAGLMFATVRHATPTQYQALKKDPRGYVVAHYEQQGRRNLAGQAATGAHPKGMSGGALFMATQDTATSARSLRLLGFITEYHKSSGLLVAVRVEGLLDGVDIQDVKWGRLFRAIDA